MNWRDRDRIQAKYRMRRLRSKSGGMTKWDRARNQAIQKLIEAHPGEFLSYRRDYLKTRESE